eukprot:s1980_g6.t1
MAGQPVDPSWPTKMLRWAVCLVFAQLTLLVGAMEKPDDCPESHWTSLCAGAASCKSLAEAGLTCSAVSMVSGCDVACASPCCITTTTTTQTATSVTETTTMSTVTATETSVTVTNTATTVTHTETATTATHTETTSMTATMTTATATDTSTVTVTTTKTVTTTQGPAALVTLVLQVETTNISAATYVEDDRVYDAWRSVMVDLTELESKQVDVEMTPGVLGNLTVTYVLTIPYNNEDGTLTPSVNLDTVKAKLMEVNANSFNEMLDAKMDEVAGAGKYVQEVVSMKETDTNAVNDAVSRHLSILLTLGLCLLGRLRAS